MRRFLFLTFVFFCPSVTLAQFDSTDEPVPYGRVIDSIERGRPLSRCVVRASDIERALTELHSGQRELKPTSALSLRNCQLDGPLNLRSVAPKVPVDALREKGVPDVWARRLELDGVRHARVIRVRISITGMTGETSVTLGTVRPASSRGAREAIIFTERVSFFRCVSKLAEAGLSLGANSTVFLEPFSASGCRFESADFEGALFAAGATFASSGAIGLTTFSDADFRGAAWMKGANFRKAQFRGHGDFRDSAFEGIATFTEVEVLPPAPKKSPPPGGPANPEADSDNLDEDEPEGGHLVFEGARFQRRAYFDDAKVDRITFSRDPDTLTEAARKKMDTEGVIPISYNPAVFHDRVIFRRSQFGEPNFVDVEFRGYADFRNVQVGRDIRLDRATFEDEADFRNAVFRGLIHLSETGFQKVAHLDWEQIAGKIQPADTETYSLLYDNFSRLDDLRSKNEAHYWKEFHRGAAMPPGWAAFENQIWRLLSGYNVRPMTILGVLLTVYLLFLLLHLAHRWKTSGNLSRVRQEFDTVVKQSAKASLTFDWKKAQQQGSLYGVQAIVMKPLLAVFLYTLANVSPVLQILTRAISI